MKSTNVALAEYQGVGCVRICECGSINLNIGVVTLHLDPETFLRTTALLQQALERYLEPREPASAMSDIHHAFGSPSNRFTN